MSTTKVKLWCEAGKHNWHRESQRGRKPLNCPKHAPAKEPPGSKKPKFVTLKCAEGGHKWKWEKRGGFPPKRCPEHRESAKKVEPQLVETYCMAGDHMYMRERKRGRAPANCPLHSANKPQAERKGLGALRTRQAPSVNGVAPVVKGLGALKKRSGRFGKLAKLKAKNQERLRIEAQEYIVNAEQRLIEAAEEEREIFDRLDKLEMRKWKNAKTRREIDELRYEWQIKSRKLNNMSSALHSTITASRRVLR